MKFYYPQLDGLRALAILLVFIHHLPRAAEYVDNFLLSNVLGRLQNFGWIGVDLFLCLSAYLITKLLLLEYKTTHVISVKNFLIRRSLRIWPLYYLALLLGFLVLPLTGHFAPPISSPEYTKLVDNHLLEYLFFVGNWSTGLSGYASGAMLSHLWTISLEEQFYIA